MSAEYIIKIVEVRGRRRWYGVRRPSRWGYYISRDGRPVARGPAIWSTHHQALHRALESVLERSHSSDTLPSAIIKGDWS